MSVRVPYGDPLGDVMSRIRTWLDDQKIEPANFTTAVKSQLLHIHTRLWEYNPFPAAVCWWRWRRKLV